VADILVVDDETSICGLLQRFFQNLGHNVQIAGTLADGLAKAASQELDIVFLDVRLPDGDGLESIPLFTRGPGNPEVVIMTGWGDKDGAELAMASGAWDYFQKPPSISQFVFTLERALQYRQQKLPSRRELVNLDREGLVGESRPMKQCLQRLAEAASSEANALITGDTGTGKELFARILHRNSSRCEKPMVVVDCASLPDNLIESFLFGHVKGAFTGADRPRQGLVKQADCGTLFLDEIGELPLELQKRLLRVLQERRYRPVGSDSEETSDFRLVAATNRDLSEMVSQGLFREDLYFRLKAFQINIPPLRERKKDIPDIARYHLDNLCQRYKIPRKGVSQDFLMILEGYDWPGNVRELFHALETAISQARDEPNLFSKHLPSDLRAKVAWDVATENAPVPPKKDFSGDVGVPVLSTFKEHRGQVVDRAEKDYLNQLIIQAGGNLSQAMEISGLGRTRLYNLMKKHNISPKG
jgi:two-component system NtrC family response regulator